MVIFGNYTTHKNTTTDSSSMLYMLEEEKLAHDVYLMMYQKWGTRQFENIKESEKIHIEKIKELLLKNNVSYQLLPEGKFENQELQKIYNQLISKGNISEIEALKVGATIEDLDIFDLKRLKNETNNSDIKNVYNFLECGSRNHLRAFNRGLSINNTIYKAQYISTSEYAEILNTSQEQCGKLNNMNCLGKGRRNCRTK